MWRERKKGALSKKRGGWRGEYGGKKVADFHGDLRGRKGAGNWEGARCCMVGGTRVYEKQISELFPTAALECAFF